MPVTRANDSRVRDPGRCGYPARVWRLALLALCITVPCARAAGVRVALLPATVVVSPGDTLDLQISVTEPGLAFNGYDAVVGFDPTALAFLPASPSSQQEGSLLTGACGNSPFNYFVAGVDSLLISTSIMCAGTSLTGPGQLYKLRFIAQDVQQGTWVHIRHIQFYDAGIYMNPAHAEDAHVFIGGAVGVPTPARPVGLSLGAAPNPCRSGTVFFVSSGRGGEQSLAVHDITGRMVRCLERGEFAPGTRHVVWDARDSAGGRVPPGVYQAVFRASGRQLCTRVAVIA